MRMVWDSGPGTVAGGMVLRFFAALIPVAILVVARWIIDYVVDVTKGKPLDDEIWWLLGVEFGLAAVGVILARGIDLCDALLADKFTRYMSVRIMGYASRLDLASYEDPVFYDKLERARVQSVDRIGMIQACGRLIQQAITAATLSASIFVFSPWLLLVLILCTVPAFIGESHFAFLGYSLNFRQTPVRRQTRLSAGARCE